MGQTEREVPHCSDAGQISALLTCCGSLFLSCFLIVLVSHQHPRLVNQLAASYLSSDLYIHKESQESDFSREGRGGGKRARVHWILIQPASMGFTLKKGSLAQSFAGFKYSKEMI